MTDSIWRFLVRFTSKKMEAFKATYFYRINFVADSEFILTGVGMIWRISVSNSFVTGLFWIGINFRLGLTNHQWSQDRDPPYDTDVSERILGVSQKIISIKIGCLESVYDCILKYLITSGFTIWPEVELCLVSEIKFEISLILPIIEMKSFSNFYV